MEKKKWKYHKSSFNDQLKNHIVKQKFSKTAHDGNKTLKPKNDNRFFQIKKAKGSKIYDQNQNSYLDFDLNQGSLILGHAHPKITRNIKNQISKGYVFPYENHLKYQLKKIILQYYPLMNCIQFYSSKLDVLLKIFSILEQVAISKNRDSLGKILFIGREFYLNYSSLTENYPLLAKYLNQYAYFLPEFNIDIIEDTIKRNNISKMKLFKNWFFKKKSMNMSMNKSEPHSTIESIVFSPMLSNSQFNSLKNQDYEDLQYLGEKYQILRILDQNYYTLRLGLKGHHPSYFMNADMYIYNQAIVSGFEQYAIASTKENSFYLLNANKTDSITNTDSNDFMETKFQYFYNSAYIAGISALKIIQYKNYYQDLKNINQLLINKTSTFKTIVQGYESMFYIRKSEDTGIENKIYSWEDFKNVYKNLEMNLYSIYFKHFRKHAIFLNPKQPFLGFLSVTHNESNIKQLIKSIENFN